jgi:hypothetical protein
LGCGQVVDKLRVGGERLPVEPVGVGELTLILADPGEGEGLGGIPEVVFARADGRRRGAGPLATNPGQGLRDAIPRRGVGLPLPGQLVGAPGGGALPLVGEEVGAVRQQERPGSAAATARRWSRSAKDPWVRSRARSGSLPFRRMKA